MRELVQRGYAIRRDSEHPDLEWGHPGETPALVRDLDVFHVQRPLTLTASAGPASTHGLTPATQSLVTAAGRNNTLIKKVCILFTRSTLLLKKIS